MAMERMDIRILGAAQRETDHRITSDDQHGTSQRLSKKNRLDRTESSHWKRRGREWDPMNSLEDAAGKRKKNRHLC